MKTPPVLTESRPPKLFQTLLSGFNIVANHVSLILLPVFVDVLLWLGPKLKLQNLLLPKLNALATSALQLNTAVDAATTLATTQKMLAQSLAQFNLAILIRTLPVGIPSLISREAVLGSPLGNMLEYQLNSFGQTALIVLALLVVGFFMGNIYFNMLARFTAKPVEKIDLKKMMYQFGQSLVMALILVVLLLMISAPVLMVLWVISFISGGIADFIMLVAIFILLWLLMPLVFSPHGVYVINQRAFPSMLLSLRMVRFFLPGTGMFVLTAALVSELLNMVWTIPDPSNWLTAVGILGHAFVVTALLAASFIYYREGLRWMQETIQHMSTPMNKPENGGPFGTTH
jgi:hypothetical protein